MSTNLIYSWKNQKHPSKTSLKKVADVLNTTPEFLEGIKPVSSEKGLTWQDFEMAYCGRLKDMYKALAEQYVKNHPEALKQSEEDEDDEL